MIFRQALPGPGDAGETWDEMGNQRTNIVAQIDQGHKIPKPILHLAAWSEKQKPPQNHANIGCKCKLDEVADTDG